MERQSKSSAGLRLNHSQSQTDSLVLKHKQRGNISNVCANQLSPPKDYFAFDQRRRESRTLEFFVKNSQKRLTQIKTGKPLSTVVGKQADRTRKMVLQRPLLRAIVNSHRDEIKTSGNWTPGDGFTEAGDGLESEEEEVGGRGDGTVTFDPETDEDISSKLKKAESKREVTFDGSKSMTEFKVDGRTYEMSQTMSNFMKFSYDPYLELEKEGNLEEFFKEKYALITKYLNEEAFQKEKEDNEAKRSERRRLKTMMQRQNLSKDNKNEPLWQRRLRLMDEAIEKELNDLDANDLVHGGPSPTYLFAQGFTSRVRLLSELQRRKQKFSDPRTARLRANLEDLNIVKDSTTKDNLKVELLLRKKVMPKEERHRDTRWLSFEDANNLDVQSKFQYNHSIRPIRDLKGYGQRRIPSRAQNPETPQKNHSSDSMYKHLVTFSPRSRRIPKKMLLNKRVSALENIISESAERLYSSSMGSRPDPKTSLTNKTMKGLMEGVEQFLKNQETVRVTTNFDTHGEVKFTRSPKRTVPYQAPTWFKWDEKRQQQIKDPRHFDGEDVDTLARSSLVSQDVTPKSSHMSKSSSQKFLVSKTGSREGSPSPHSAYSLRRPDLKKTASSGRLPTGRNITVMRHGDHVQIVEQNRSGFRTPGSAHNQRVELTSLSSARSEGVYSKTERKKKTLRRANIDTRVLNRGVHAVRENDTMMKTLNSQFTRNVSSKQGRTVKQTQESWREEVQRLTSPREVTRQVIP